MNIKFRARQDGDKLVIETSVGARCRLTERYSQLTVQEMLGLFDTDITYAGSPSNAAEALIMSMIDLRVIESSDFLGCFTVGVLFGRIIGRWTAHRESPNKLLPFEYCEELEV